MARFRRAAADCVMQALPSERRLPTLFVPYLEGRSPGEIIPLCEAESRHVRALRLPADAMLRLTDGRGSDWVATFAGDGERRRAVVLVQALVVKSPLPLELAFPVANKAHTLWLVEKMAEFAVGRLQPLEFERSRSVADAARSPSFWQKARNRALAAVKQSGGSWLPELGDVVSVPDYLDREVDTATGLRVLLDRGGPPLATRLGDWDARSGAVLLVGPEGGLTGAEECLIERAGIQKGRLGDQVLRFETAAVAAVAIAAQRWELTRAQAEPRPREDPRSGGVA